MIVDVPCYLIGRGIAYNDFRERLARAKIEEAREPQTPE